MRIRSNLQSGQFSFGGILDSAMGMAQQAGQALSSFGSTVVETVTDPKFWTWPF